MYSFGPRRFLARWVVGLGALAAFPFVGAGVAQASLAGAPPATTNFRPDLRTVHILTGINAGRVQFCFDKPLATPNPGAAASFKLGGYRWDTVLPGFGATAPVLDSTGFCAIVTMTPANNGGAADLNSYSFGTVLAGAVVANVSGGLANLADSAPSLDSTSHSGTTGHTTGPDLQGVTVGSPAGTNEMIYTFDQPVDSTTLNPGNFAYYDAAGNFFFGAAITGVDSVGDVRVAFAVPTTSTAVIAYIAGGGVNDPTVSSRDNAPAPSTRLSRLSVTVPGTAGITARPDQTGAMIVPGSTNQIDYTFDQNVSLVGGSAAAAAGFAAVASNGDQITGAQSTVLADGKTVRVTFSGPNITNYLEEVVIGSIVTDGVITNANGKGNVTQGKPVGGNAGAFATGFTNAPDATGVTFDASSGQAVVRFDQRVAANAAGQPVDQTGTTPTPLGSWLLLDANGNILAAPTSATVESTGPYTSDVRLTFANPPLLGVAKSLAVLGNQNPSNATDPYTTFAGAPFLPAVFTSGNPHGDNVAGMNPAGNVMQILAPTVTGASLQGKGTTMHLRWVHITRASYLKAHHKHARKASKRH